MRNVFCKISEIKEHTYGYEEEAHERVSEGQDLCHNLVAVFRFGYDEPCDKCAQGKGQAGMRCKPRSAEAEEKDCEGEDLPVSELYHLIKDSGDQGVGCCKDDAHGCCREQKRVCDREKRYLFCAGYRL